MHVDHWLILWKILHQRCIFYLRQSSPFTRAGQIHNSTPRTGTWTCAASTCLSLRPKWTSVYNSKRKSQNIANDTYSLSSGHSENSEGFLQSPPLWAWACPHVQNQALLRQGSQAFHQVPSSETVSIELSFPSRQVMFHNSMQFGLHLSQWNGCWCLHLILSTIFSLKPTSLLIFTFVDSSTAYWVLQSCFSSSNRFS